MKTKPAVLAALLAVAVAVSGEFAAVVRNGTRTGDGWLAHARSGAPRELISGLAKAGAGAIVRWAKS